MNRLEFIIKASTPQGALGPVGFFPNEETFFDDGDSGVIIKDEDALIIKEGKHYKITIEEIDPEDYMLDDLKVSYTNKNNDYFEKIFDYDEIANNLHIDEISDSPLLKDYEISEISVIKK